MKNVVSNWETEKYSFQKDNGTERVDVAFVKDLISEFDKREWGKNWKNCDK